MKFQLWGLLAIFVLSPLLGSCTRTESKEPAKILNVSYDPTRELYADFNQAFIKYWKTKSGQDITVEQSHGGSGKQARAVIDGLPADVVTLALAYDIDALHDKANLVPADWQKRLPNNSAPYTSTIVFLVRKGNPKHIKDWDDIVKPGINVVTPSPKTSGGARWNFLAAWAYAAQKFNQDEAQIKDFITKLYRNAPIQDSGARGATITFVQRGLGDVLLAWENEAYLSLKEKGGDQFEIVYPSLSILAEPPVTWVDANVDKNGTKDIAQAYLEYLYTDEGQTIAAQNFYRPTSPKIKAQFAKQFPSLDLVTIDQAFGGWQKAQKTYFDDGGVYDEISKR